MVYFSFYIFIVGSCEDIIRPPWETLVRKIVQWMDDSETAYTQIVVSICLSLCALSKKNIA